MARNSSKALQLVLPDEYAPAGSYEIDGAVAELRLHPRWNARADAHNFARRALFVATMEAIDASELDLHGEWIGTWEEGYGLALKASVAMPGLVNFLARDRRGKDKLAKHGAAALEAPLRQMCAHLYPSLSPPDRVIWAADQARSLVATRYLLEQLEGHMLAMRDMLAASRENAGKPEKAAFVLTMAEAWVFLTGKLPGSNPNPSRTPFLRFVETAWGDVGPEQDSFVSATRVAINHLKKQTDILAEHYRPRWLGQG